MNEMKQATYRIIHFIKCNRYIGVAWNYNEAVLISTKDCETYTEAKSNLAADCLDRNVELRWFDGEYKCEDGDTLIYKCEDGDTLIPLGPDEIPGKCCATDIGRVNGKVY